jgi:uncharacterized protein YndB with AHSA1/START domain
VFRVVIEADLEAVWREITRTDAPILAFFNSRMDAGALAPGATIAMRTPSGRHTGVVGEILEFDPPRRFSHTFRFTAYDDPPCTVAYDLKQLPQGVEFTLTLVDLPVGTKTAKQMVAGGTMIVNTLKSVMETGKPSFGTRMLYVLFAVMTPLTPKRCRSEHWPVQGPEAEKTKREQTLN